MSESEEDRDRRWLEIEVDAQMYVQRGDNSKMVALLRQLYLPGEVPDLSFIADLLENKSKKPAGRPADGKILAGVKMQRAGLTVRGFINQGLTVEVAVAKASEVLSISEGSIKKRYRQFLKEEIAPK